MNISELKKMSALDRLQAMEALWDSFLYENDEIETPEWHEKIITERKDKIIDGTAKFISLSELKKSRQQ